MVNSRVHTIVACCAVVLLAGCTSTIPESWQDAEVGALKIELTNSTEMERLWFCEDHTVTAEVGQKDGSAVGAILNWHVAGKRLKLESHDGQTYKDLQLVSNSPQSLVVRNEAGVTFTYRHLPRTSAC
jgi:hypothetical protein